MKLKVSFLLIGLVFLVASCEKKFDVVVEVRDSTDIVISTSVVGDVLYITTYSKLDSTYRVYTDDKYGNVKLFRSFKIKNK